VTFISFSSFRLTFLSVPPFIPPDFHPPILLPTLTGNKFGFSRPDLTYHSIPGRSRGQSSWRATLSVAGSKVGVGHSRAKKDATNRAYLDTALYLESCDPALWTGWVDRKKSNLVAKGKAPANVEFTVSEQVEDELREAVHEAAESELYVRAKEMVRREHEKAEKERERFLAARRGVDLPPVQDPNAPASQQAQQLDPAVLAKRAELREKYLTDKSAALLTRLKNYQASAEPAITRLRDQRASLPVSSHASLVLSKIATSSVVVVLAATGSGKTTQLPQLILDDATLDGKGAETNIVCTQPRRIAAISVAERVAKERGESVGVGSVGYQVRFESKPPQKDGSILFCTTGLFLRRMQADLDRQSGGAASAAGGTEEFLDGVTHVCVDEVHERDVDTDLLLFVLRRLLSERRKRGKREIKVVLMCVFLFSFFSFTRR
jgi:hypothetical protein